MSKRAQIDPVTEHLAHLKVRGLRQTTIRARADQLRRLAGHLGVEPGEALLCVTRDDLERWQMSMVHLSPRYRRSATAHVRCFYAWTVRAEVLDRDPSVTLAGVKVPQSMPRPIGEADLSMAINCAPDRLRAMLVLAAYAGMRVTEIASLTRDQVLDQADPPVLLVTGKGGKERVVPMSDRVLAELRAHGLPTRGSVFPRHDGRPGQNTAQNISHMLNAYLHDMNIADTAHSLRHRAGTQLYAVSHDIRVVQALLGHASPSTTAGYVAWSSAAAVAAVQALPGADLAGSAALATFAV